MKKLLIIINNLLYVFCVLLMCVLVVSVIWQVFSRYVLAAPSTLTDELARFLFIWLGLLGAAYTLGQKKHLAMDYLLMKLAGRSKGLLQFLIDITCMSFASVVMVYGGGSLMLKTLKMGQVSPVLGVEMGFVYAAIPISGALMILYLYRDVMENLPSVVRGDVHKN